MHVTTASKIDISYLKDLMVRPTLFPVMWNSLQYSFTSGKFLKCFYL